MDVDDFQDPSNPWIEVRGRRVNGRGGVRMGGYGRR